MSMKKPDTVYPASSTSYPSFMPDQILDPSIKGASFDQLLQNRGIRFVHRIAVPCPNINNLSDNNHDPYCQYCEGDGFIYYQEKEIWGVFYSNALTKQYEQQGTWEVGTAVITFPSEYPDGTQADFNAFDQLYIPDFTVRMWELLEYEPKTNNRQYIRYPIEKLDYMSSITAGALKVYSEGVDFDITDGAIEWIQAPAYDSVTDTGEVLTLSYFAHPVYVVLQNIRELRITQEYVNGQKISRRLPQQVQVRRDYLANVNERKRSQ